MRLASSFVGGGVHFRVSASCGTPRVRPHRHCGRGNLAAVFGTLGALRLRSLLLGHAGVRLSGGRLRAQESFSSSCVCDCVGPGELAVAMVRFAWDERLSRPVWNRFGAGRPAFHGIVERSGQLGTTEADRDSSRLSDGVRMQSLVRIGNGRHDLREESRIGDGWRPPRARGRSRGRIPGRSRNTSNSTSRAYVAANGAGAAAV